MKKFYALLFMTLFLFTSITAFASDTICPAIVHQAFAVTTSACAATGRNQVCYGNIHLSAEEQAGAPPITFSQPGDLAKVTTVKTLTLSPLDQQQDSWGVAVMKLQANLPDALPGQNVTFILFGDVQMQNAVPPAPDLTTLDVAAKNSANVRSSPAVTGGIVTALAHGQTVSADGRTQASDWLHIHLDNGDIGWVSAPLVTVTGDVQTLAVMDADSASAAPALNPMQAFYFRSGYADAPCSEVPDSGILIQSPQSTVKVNLLVNGVSISLGSTIYIQAQPNGLLTINVLEGGVQVTFGATAYVPAGSQVQFRLDQNLSALDFAGPVRPYDAQSLNALPIRLLETPIVAAPPLNPTQLNAAEAQIAKTFPAPHVSALSAGGCSVKGDTSTTATFVNHSNRVVSVYWLDYNCHEVFYANLQPGASYDQLTFATHPWVMRDTITGDLLAGPARSAKGEKFTLTVGG